MRSRLVALCALIGSILAQGSPDDFCPLCGQEPVLLPPPVPNGPAVTLGFDTCCPYSTYSTTGDCVNNPSTESYRTVGFSEPITETDDFVSMCMDISGIVFKRSDRTPCCESCTCFGDPNCISFDGTEEIWIVCDSRTLSKRHYRRNYCPFTQTQCIQEVDPAGNQCEWGPEKKGITLKEWMATESSSPCQPAEITYIKMYEADSFSLVIGQGERGNIKELELTLKKKKHKMVATDCLNNGIDDTWTGDDIDGSFQRTEEMHGLNGLNDKIWHVLDEETGIGMTVRCTATLVNGVQKSPRFNIESVHEPSANFRDDRKRLGGFCITNDLGNKNKSPHTTLIEENGYCKLNAPTNDATVARIVCQNHAIPQNGVGQCYKQFCTEYWRPYYDSVENCFEVISNSSNPTHWEDGFCTAFNDPKEPGDFEECKKTIEEFGWEVVTNTYYKSDRPQGECIESFEDLPDELDECENGVVLQVYQDGAWVNVKAISETRPLCDAEISICYDTYPDIFRKQLRWIQTRETQNCQKDTCSQQDGFEVVVTIDRVTKEPTPEPTSSPSATPTGSPSKSPSTSPTKSPTTTPSSSPSKSPTTAPSGSPTSSPTASPSKNPSSSPTRSPSTSPSSSPSISPSSNPTKSPSSSPSKAPTANPTFEPTSKPTERPTGSPTNDPTSQPTPDPTASPTKDPTSEPTERPTGSPTNDPTSQPTPDPTASPTKDPTSEPTERPTGSPTNDPTSQPTPDPTASPTKDPTSEPTQRPTGSPTNDPTSLPTTDPTASPTKDPTSEPTQGPSASPTNDPTSLPTKGPTASPTRKPTSLPTSGPTSSPSSRPTGQPTDIPSASPSSAPTFINTQTGIPTSLPTSDPTPGPTGSPSKVPTNDPTSAPSKKPTDEPSAQPTNAPSNIPTDLPTSAPTTLPTATPTKTPTPEPGNTGPPNPPNSDPTAEPTSVPSQLPPTGVPSRITVGPTSTTLSPTTSISSAPTVPPFTFPPSICVEPVTECPPGTPGAREALPDGTSARIQSGKEVVWIITEPTSGISTKVRCTANFGGKKAYVPRLGIEDLIDPSPEDRTYSCGYCPTSEMERTGDTANTDFLDATGNCSSRPRPVEISQAICAPYLQFESFDECARAICSAHWFPNYKSPNSCEKKFRKNEEDAFCTLFNSPGSPDFEECVDDIDDFGWKFAAEKYLPSNDEALCSSDPRDFPKELSDCQTGAEIQYFVPGSDEWVTYVAVPSDSDRPLCSSGLQFNADDHKVLFKYAVRVKQTSLPRDTCITVSTCTVTQRVSTELSYSRSKPCSKSTVGSPSDPLVFPENGVTLCNKVYESNDCVEIPQLSGSPASYETTLTDMPECCAPKDTENTIPELGIVPGYKFSRYSQACSPICDYGDSSKCCNELGEDDTLTVKVVFSGSVRDSMCCVSCTCYGDPRCISFEGVKVSWIPCDARDASTANERNYCASTKEKCDKTIDPAGNKCLWFPEDDTSKGWDVLKKGGACKASAEGTFSCLTMYKTPTFSMGVKQGDRGVIVSARLRMGTQEYTIDAKECLEEKQPWRKINN